MEVAPLFVYGSLMSRSVLRSLLGRVPLAHPAVLHGYKRLRVTGQPFPALVAANPTSVPVTVHGLVLSDLTSSEKLIFDHFEDEEYVKQIVHASLLENVQEPFDWAFDLSMPPSSDSDGGDTVLDALAYVWTDETLLDEREWVPERDFLPHEAAYIRMCDEFVQSPEISLLRQEAT